MAVFNPLKISDLRKDENRPLTFIRKVKDGEEFATVKHGNVVILASDLQLVKLFMTADNNRFPKSNTSISVKTKNGIKLKVPNDFLKTGDFGGRGQGSGVAAETLAMNFFNDNLNKILVKLGKSYINLRINNRTVKCAAMVKTEGKYQGREPKSDMTIVDETGKPVAYISHKAGRTAKDYQQYGGLSYTQYANNADIKNFMQSVLAQAPKGLTSGQSFYRNVSDKKLVSEAMYGPEFARRTPSISNVDEFHLGNMTLKGVNQGPYSINSLHKGTNGEQPTGEFQAVYFIRYQALRGDAKAGGEVVPNARVGIFPKAKTSGTSKKI